MFLTNPETPSLPSHNLARAQNGYFDFKEAVVVALEHLGIPFEKAQLAVIDFRARVIECHKAKRNAMEAAVYIVDDVRRIYKIEMPV